MTLERTENIALTLIILFALVLGVSELSDIYLWDDEGWTMILAKSILNNGFPKNKLPGYELCYFYGFNEQGFLAYQPWLPFYFTAGFMALFGNSILFLRLPFVLLQVSSVGLTWQFAKRLDLSRSTRLLAALFMASNVPLILLSRNVRYYSMMPFFTLLLLQAYWDLKEKGKYFKFTLISIAFLHTMPPVAAGVMMAIFIHALFFEKQKEKIAKLILSQLLASLFFIPWLIFSWKGMTQTFSGSLTSFPDAGGQLGFTAAPLDVMYGATLYLKNFVRFNFPFLLVPFIIWQYIKKKALPSCSKDIIFLTVTIAICTACMNSALQNQRLWSGYMVAAIPLGLILAAIMIAGVSQNKHYLRILLAVVFLSSNLLNLPYWPEKTREHSFFINHLSFLLPNYFKEISTEYQGPVEGLINFLATRVKPGDTYLSTNDGHTIHLMTGMQRIQTVPFEKPPTWIIHRANFPWNFYNCDENKIPFNHYVTDFIQSNPYEVFELTDPDVQQENFPVLPGHYWTTPKHYRHVKVYHYVGKNSV